MILTIYIIISVITFLVLKTNNDIKISLLSSNIFGEEVSKLNKNLLIGILTLVSPYTLYKIISILIKSESFADITDYENYKKIKLKIKLKNMKWLITILVLIALGFGVKYVGSNAINYYNQSIEMELGYDKLMNQRLSIIDKMEKIVYQELQISKINDSSFRKNIAIVMDARRDQAGLFMKWVKEINPNENYGNVSELYTRVMNSIESERNSLMSVESALQSIDYSYRSLHKKIPSSIYLFYRPSELGYEPVSTSANKIVNQTGVDEKVEL